jgi:hypothetical protein
MERTMRPEACACRDQSLWHSRRLWSLLDMMNFVLSSFIGALKLLDQEIALSGVRSGNGIVPIELDAADKDRATNILKFVTDTCRRMSLQGAENRLERITVLMRTGTNYAALHTALKVLRESIEDDVKYERFYHYPKEAGNLSLRTDADWNKTLLAFPSKDMYFEIHSGMDCMALQHPTSAIFHFMRVAEFGLRALAKERRVKLPKHPIEWATWQDLIREIDNQVKKFANTARGSKKDDALGFYSGAIAHFTGFKDQYRNSVMHVRKAYLQADAEMAMRQVRDFMNGLSEKIGEQTKGPIKW